MFSGDEETNEAIARNEVVGLFSGKPTGRATWGIGMFGSRGGLWTGDKDREDRPTRRNR